jgi:hypothetical protein
VASPAKSHSFPPVVATVDLEFCVLPCWLAMTFGLWPGLILDSMTCARGTSGQAND